MYKVTGLSLNRKKKGSGSSLMFIKELAITVKRKQWHHTGDAILRIKNVQRDFLAQGGVTEFVRRCEMCQKHGKIEKLISPELQSVPVPSEVMKQIGIDICNLPEVDGYKHLVVCIGYFSKWLETKPLKDKLAESVSKFLYEIICRHGCMRIQINDQGKEFVNEVITNLHEMAGIDQRITSAYHPQSNGLCEQQNRNIKESLVKVLNAKPSEWPYVVEGVLFAHRVNKHSSTKFSPFFLMYNRRPVLPVDIKYNLNGTDETSENDQPFNMEVFNAILSSTLSLREEAHQEASKNIAKAQEKQQKDYNRRHTVPTSLKTKDKVWLKNQRRQERKGGKFSYKWTGPYTIEHITKKGLFTLKNERSTVPAKKFNVGLLKPYLDLLAVGPQDEEELHAVPPDEKPASTQSEECI